MKKIFLMIAAFSLMAFVAVSCDPEDDNVNNSTDSVVPTILFLLATRRVEVE